MFKCLSCFLVFLLFYGCAAKKPVIIERNIHDTAVINHLRVDSFKIRDSIYFETIAKGDTIYKNKYIYRWREHTSNHTDTLYLNRVTNDTIPISVVRNLSTWERYVTLPLKSPVLYICIAILAWIAIRLRRT